MGDNCNIQIKSIQNFVFVQIKIKHKNNKPKPKWKSENVNMKIENNILKLKKIINQKSSSSVNKNEM